MADRGCSLTLRWTPGHAGVEGNELRSVVPDQSPERSASTPGQLGPPEVQGLRSSQQRARYQAMNPTKHEPPRVLCPAEEAWLSASSQEREKGASIPVLPTPYWAHAITEPYLKEKLHKRDSDECWFCLSGKRQTREHLFKECDRWQPQIRYYWEATKVFTRKNCGYTLSALRETVPQGLKAVPPEQILRYFEKFERILEAYTAGDVYGTQGFADKV
ncbi:hypothetical protein FN846DRAFT_917154 [Sphaerosporella brunnea]|uniref:RNase H type-1 domain-containing protein n=1 Tax=Sphaerosporella brunnea TaxID=1250544 RepID=A0A5J5F4N5_9PEZI|nr:hypothetical protein FN846DRAFT_917154 [Sphaerosporella brunnea]